MCVAYVSRDEMRDDEQIVKDLELVDVEKSSGIKSLLAKFTWRSGGGGSSSRRSYNVTSTPPPEGAAADYVEPDDDSEYGFGSGGGGRSAAAAETSAGIQLLPRDTRKVAVKMVKG